MNVEQLNAFEELQRAVEDDLRGSRLFFLEGAGGTGKTFLYKCLYFHLRSKGVKVKLVFSNEIMHGRSLWLRRLALRPRFLSMEPPFIVSLAFR